jgi:hypothetical protein
MARLELIHSQGTYQVSCVRLITKCDLFKNNPGLILRLYHVQSEVSLEDNFLKDERNPFQNETVIVDFIC